MFDTKFQKYDCGGKACAVYKNPEYPVHVVTGAPGNREKINTFENDTPDWSALRLEEYSFTTLNVTKNSLEITQWNDDARNPKKIDNFRIERETL